MGYIRHHAIVVTGPMQRFVASSTIEHRPTIADVRERCFKMTSLTSPVVAGKINGDASFFVAPDCSKEGWTESDAGDVARDAIIEYLRSLAYEDGSTSFPWVEVQFGDDNRQTVICRDSDHPRCAE